MREIPDWCVEAETALRAALVPVDTVLGPRYPGHLIAIDGRTAVGKTTLARYLTWAINVPHIEGDMYLEEHETEYRHRHDDLARIIDSRMTEHLPRPIIIESVTALRLLKRIGRRPDYLIYTQNNEEFDETSSHANDMLSYEAEYNPRARADLLLTIPTPSWI